MLRLGGLFNPCSARWSNCKYLGGTPVLLHDSALSAAFGGLQKTSHEKGVRRMVKWMRSQVRTAG